MPCAGPDKELSDATADAAYEKVMALLATSYNIRELDTLRWTVEHDAAKTKLREALRELFWTDACDGW